MVQRYDLSEQLKDVFQAFMPHIHGHKKAIDRYFDLIKDVAKLEVRVKELEDQNRWIPVEEALPDDYGEVLLVHSIYGIGIGHYSPKLKKFTGVFASVLIDEAEVTHWKRIILP